MMKAACTLPKLTTIPCFVDTTLSMLSSQLRGSLTWSAVRSQLCLVTCVTSTQSSEQ